MATFRAVQPVLSVRDVQVSTLWYANLGFEPLFVDDTEQPRYGGVGRDGVEIHLQWHHAQEWSDGLQGAVYRFLVDDPDGLYHEVGRQLGESGPTPVGDTAWGTREFGLFDPDHNALFLYRNL